MFIHEEEGPAVKQIFDWASDGLSFEKIAQNCIKAGFPPPARRLGGGTWTARNVCVILHNEIYKGRLIWGRTKQKKHYKSGKNTAVPVPQSEWTVVDYPDLAIVSGEQWDRVQAIIASRRRLGLSQLGGMAKRSGVQVPLLIGLVKCGICKQPVVACATNATGGRVLGCKRHKYEKRTCANAYTIDEIELEEAIIQHLVGEVMETRSVELALTDFHRKIVEETECRIRAMRKKLSGGEHVQAQIRHAEGAIRNVLDSLQASPKSKSLLAELARWEEKLDVLKTTEQIETIEPELPSFDEARDFLLAEIRNLADVLKSNRPATRDALLRHIDVLELYPELRNGVPVFRIKGSFEPHQAIAKVTPSERRSKTLRQYEEFSLMFEPTVLARTCKVDYLAHPSCSIENVKLFIEKGLTIRQIAQELDTTTFIVQRVLRALNLQPSRINYLAHPKCPPELLLEGRRLGKPYSLIASELGISLNTLMGVKRALDATGVIVPDLDNPSSLNSKADYLNYPKCPAADVIRLRSSGRTMAEIALEFGVATPVISRIIHAIQTSTGSPIEPIPGSPRVHRYPHSDYLNHPKCPTTEVARLQALGRTIEEIAIELRTNHQLVGYVSQAMRDPSKRFRARHSFNSSSTPGTQA